MHTALSIRVRELLRPQTRDAGEGPVPYIIMVAIMGIAAVAIAGAIRLIADHWVTQVPRNP
jgi:hypothetical protein